MCAWSRCERWAAYTRFCFRISKTRSHLLFQEFWLYESLSACASRKSALGPCPSPTPNSLPRHRTAPSRLHPGDSPYTSPRPVQLHPGRLSQHRLQSAVVGRFRHVAKRKGDCASAWFYGIGLLFYSALLLQNLFIYLTLRYSLEWIFFFTILLIYFIYLGNCIIAADMMTVL